MRVAHPLIARAHLLLRFDRGNWIAIDNDSQSGMFVDGQRVSEVDIYDGLTINIGKPTGPWITFEVGHHQGIIGRLSRTPSSALILTKTPATGDGISVSTLSVDTSTSGSST